MSSTGKPKRVLIMGAAGRDFHNFNVAFRDDPACEVVAFTAAQIPGISGRRYPAALAGDLPLFDAGDQLIITHGNGPQVGLLALQVAAGPMEGAYPLDVLDAESEGMVGYLIEQQLGNALPSGRLIATLLTQIRVDRRDPAFRRPTKPIGRVYEKAQAEKLARARGWAIAEDRRGWRRVVASPQPMQILEARVIELLVSQGVTVI